jgi:release factor glutamine methyltransferase
MPDKLPPTPVPVVPAAGDYEHVYEPSDDTFLLLDSLTAEADLLRQLQPKLCVEIGSGSGCVITHLASLLPEAMLLAGDINRVAVAATLATAAANKQQSHLDACQMDLLGALRPGSVDVLVFNPPYVPTSDEELEEAERTTDISAAWAGGERGRRVLDRLLPLLGAALSPTGVFYLLGVSENDPQEIARMLLEEQQLESHMVAERRAQNERLFVMRFSRQRATTT